MTAPGKTVRQFETHAPLLADFRRGSARLDGIVVPATRNEDSLRHAVELGVALDVPVVFLCSGRARPREIIRRTAETPGARCWAVDMNGLQSYGRVPSFKTSEFTLAIDNSYGDLSLKRNLGLLIGRAAGWKTVLFLDDDIYGLNSTAVRRAVGGLEHHTVVGMPATEFPDNSVLCHALRTISGHEQDVFVSGSALAVNVEKADSFFPEIYNEDWMFLAPQMVRGLVAKRGRVKQRTYYPFDSPARAARQEFGDVLAEGLYGYLHFGGWTEAPPEAYWREFLRHRMRLLRTTVNACPRRNTIKLLAKDAKESLLSALEVSSGIEPRLLVDYVKAWREDLVSWRRHIRDISCVGSLDKALTEIGLRGMDTFHYVVEEASSALLEGSDAHATIDGSRGRQSAARRHGPAIDSH